MHHVVFYVHMVHCCFCFVWLHLQGSSGDLCFSWRFFYTFFLTWMLHSIFSTTEKLFFYTDYGKKAKASRWQEPFSVDRITQLTDFGFAVSASFFWGAWPVDGEKYSGLQCALNGSDKIIVSQTLQLVQRQQSGKAIFCLLYVADSANSHTKRLLVQVFANVFCWVWFWS